MSRRFKPLAVARIGDLPGACSGCVFWETAERLERKCGALCDTEASAGWMEYVAAQWGDPGRVAYEDGEVLGFVKYAPAGFFPQALHLPSGRPSDDAVLLACLHVDPDSRHVGLGKVLLTAALRDLASRGERVVEAYATHKPVHRKESPMVSVEFLLRNGFTVVRPHPVVPLMRLEIRSLVAWTENVEAVLESLQLPLRARRAVPSPYPKTMDDAT